MFKQVETWLAMIAFFGMLSAASSTEAHPHAWIDLRSRVLLDDKGHVRALQLDWVFDDYYTVALAEAGEPIDEVSGDVWKALAKRNLINLAEYDYFTEATYDDDLVELGLVERYEGGLQDGRMWMRFEVPLIEPVDPKAGAFRYAVFDPTYYIEIAHLKDDVIAFDGQGADACLGEIIQPNPTFEQVSLASALDKDETAGADIGKLFAETVAVQCS